jgi:hypothetical protein
VTTADRYFWRILIAGFLLIFIALSAYADYAPQFTVSLYKSTTKSGDYTGPTQQAAWDACTVAAKTLQATTTSKVTCKTPVLSLVVIAPPPPPVTASVTLSWPLVTMNTNDSPYVDPFGYVINYGTAVDQLTQSIDVNDPKATSYVVTGLTTGTYFFCVRARNTSNVRSDCSNVVSKTL